MRSSIGGWVSKRRLKKLPWCSDGLSIIIAATAWLKRSGVLSFWAIVRSAVISPAGFRVSLTQPTRVTPGGERVWTRVADHVDLRHRQAVADGKRLDDVVELLVLARVGGLRAHCGEHR